MDSVLKAKKDQFTERLKDDQQQKVIEAFDLYHKFLVEHGFEEEVGLAYMNICEYLHNHDNQETMIRLIVEYTRKVDQDIYPKDAAYYALASTLEFRQENYDNAMRLLEGEIKLYKNKGNQRAIATCMNNLGYLKILAGKSADALDLLTEAKSYLLEIDKYGEYAGYTLRINLAHVYLELKEYDKARSYLNEVLNWSQIESNPNIKVELYMTTGQYYAKIQEFDSAILQLEEAIEIANEKGMKYELRKLYKIIADLFVANEQYDRGCKYLKLYAEIVGEMATKVQKATKYKAIAEIALLDKEKQIQKKKNQYLEIVRNQEYDLLTNTFSRDYLLGHIEELIANREEIDNFYLVSFEIIESGNLYKRKGFRSVEKLLVEVASEIVNYFPTHVTARHGRTKFMVVVTQSSQEKVMNDSNLLLTKLTDLSSPYCNKTCVTSSLVDYKKSKAEDVSTLMRMANLALYQAEASNDQSVVYW